MRRTRAYQANAGLSRLDLDSTKDVSRKGHASQPTSSRLRVYAQELQHRTVRKKQSPTLTHSKILQGHDEAADRVPTLDHGHQPPLLPNHRREHAPRQYHDDYLRKTQTSSPERTAPQGSAPRALDLRTDNRDHDNESKASMLAPKPTRVPASGPPSTSDEQCHAYTQATKLLLDVLCVDCTYASGDMARTACETSSSMQGHLNRP